MHVIIIIALCIHEIRNHLDGYMISVKCPAYYKTCLKYFRENVHRLCTNVHRLCTEECKTSI